MERIRFGRVAGIVGLVLSALLFAAGTASAGVISFNDFYRDPLASVVIASDGSTAQLAESADLSLVFLSNVPGFGDPNIILAQSGAKLSFNYDFIESEDNDDLFHVALLDGNTGDVLNPAFEAIFTSSASGVIEFDLSSLAGSLLGLQFELASNPSDLALTSTLSLSNLQITLPPELPPTSVPEPSMLSLFFFGVVLFGFGLKRTGFARAVPRS